MFGVTILGNNSAIPAYDRHPTAQIVTLNDQLFLIDCGEGTQMQLNRYKVRRSNLNHILISHLHGDHYFGLIGLLTSMGLLGRQQELHLHAPAPLEDIIRLQLAAANTQLPYPLHFHASTEGIIVDHNKFSIEAFKVEHRIECYGYIIREKKRKRKLHRSKALEHGIPTAFFQNLKEGQDYTNKDGFVIKNEWVTEPNAINRSYAFCADTIFTETYLDKIKNVSLLYHEATYLKTHADKAVSRFHCTTEQAALIAKKVNANRLIIGHFSSKYETLNEFLQEAREIFPTTELALEGITYLI